MIRELERKVLEAQRVQAEREKQVADRHQDIAKRRLELFQAQAAAGGGGSTAVDTRNGAHPGHSPAVGACVCSRSMLEEIEEEPASRGAWPPRSLLKYT